MDMCGALYWKIINEVCDSVLFSADRGIRGGGWCESSRMEETYFVVGATGGIGRALVGELRARGLHVLAVARDAQALAELAAEHGCATATCDARDPQAVEACVAQVQAEGGRLAGAACLVGSILLKPAHSTRPEEFAEVLAQNLGTAFHVLRAAAGAMQRSGGGSILLMSSAAAQQGLANHEAIAAAKAGVEGLVRSAAATYAAKGVRVNALAPGLVRTPLSERLTASPTSLAASEAMHPLGRIGEPEEVARLAAFLLDPSSSWITGQCIGVDGGLSTLVAKR
jgi:NAD(P)-dependent dehydrogenase (short-subunit alcohol dehydrogenase family)